MARNIRFDLITNYNPRGVRAAETHLRGLQTRLARTSSGFQRSFHGLTEGVKEFGTAFSGIKDVFELIKIPAMIAGVKVLASALSAAASGAVSFVSAIAPASGAIVALPQAFLGIAATAGVVKLATGGVGDALKALGTTGPGSAEKIKKALAALPPPTRAFVKDLNKLRPELAKLKVIAATPIMGAFQKGLQAVRPLLPLVREGVRQTAREIARFVSGAAGVARTPLFRATAASILKTNTIALRSLGGAGINLARAFVYVARDAQPLVRWLIQLTARIGNTAASFLTAQAKAGGLRRFFTDSRNSISRLVRLFGNLGAILVAVFGGGKALGDSLLVSLVNLTATWREFVTSSEGRETIAEVFARAKGPLIEAAKLLGDILKVIAGLTKSESLGPIISQVRTELLPSVNDLLNAFDHITPVIVDALVKLGRLFSAIIAQDGGLIHVVGTIGNMAGAFASLLEQHPQLANFASALTILGPSITAIKFITLITGVRGIGKAFLGGRTAAVAFRTGFIAVRDAALLTRVQLLALSVQTVAVAVASRIAAVAAKAWAVAQRILNFVLAANPIGLVIAAIALLVVGLVLAYKKSDTFRRIVDAAFRAVVAAGRFLRDRIAEHFRAIQVWWQGTSRNVISLRDKAVAAFRAVVDAAQKMGGWIARVARNIATWVDTIIRFINGLPGRAYRALADLPNFLGRRAREAWDAFFAKAKERWEAIRKWASGIPASFVVAMGDLGKSLIDKFSGAVKRVLQFLGLKKDTGVFAQMGRMMVDEIALGIADRMKRIPNLLARLSSLAFGALGFGGGGPGAPAGGRGGVVELARRMAAGVGWVGAQWNALYQLVQHESGWRTTAQNPISTAYGLFQFLDSTWASVGATKTSSAVGQIAAGFRYIKSRYRDPIGAWNFWQGHHWYEKGTPFVPRTGPAFLHRGEMVIPSRAAGQIRRGGGGGNTYNITVAVPVSANPADVGAAIVEKIRYYEKRNGTGWRR